MVSHRIWLPPPPPQLLRNYSASSVSPRRRVAALQFSVGLCAFEKLLFCSVVVVVVGAFFNFTQHFDLCGRDDDGDDDDVDVGDSLFGGSVSACGFMIVSRQRVHFLQAGIENSAL